MLCGIGSESTPFSKTLQGGKGEFLEGVCVGADGEDDGPVGRGLEAVAQPCDGAIGTKAAVGGVDLNQQVVIHRNERPLLEGLVALLPVAAGDEVGEKLGSQ